MRARMIWVCGLLAACSTGAVTVPQVAGVYEVPPERHHLDRGWIGRLHDDDRGRACRAGRRRPSGAHAGRAGFRRPMASAPGSTTTASTCCSGRSSSRRSMPPRRSSNSTLRAASWLWCSRVRCRTAVDGANVALYAQQSSNPVGVRVYDRSVGSRVAGGCGKYRDGNSAQRAFLTAGGPQDDRYGLDADGDGFACQSTRLPTARFTEPWGAASAGSRRRELRGCLAA